MHKWAFTVFRRGRPFHAWPIVNWDIGLAVCSLLTEALFLVFALFSRQRTPGKEPLLAGKPVWCGNLKLVLIFFKTPGSGYV